MVIGTCQVIGSSHDYSIDILTLEQFFVVTGLKNVPVPSAHQGVDGSKEVLVDVADRDDLDAGNRSQTAEKRAHAPPAADETDGQSIVFGVSLGGSLISAQGHAGRADPQDFHGVAAGHCLDNVLGIHGELGIRRDGEMERWKDGVVEWWSGGVVEWWSGGIEHG